MSQVIRLRLKPVSLTLSWRGGPGSSHNPPASNLIGTLILPLPAGATRGPSTEWGGAAKAAPEVGLGFSQDHLLRFRKGGHSGLTGSPSACS